VVCQRSRPSVHLCCHDGSVRNNIRTGMVLQKLAAVEEGGIEALWWEKKWGAQFYRGDMAAVRLLPHKLHCGIRHQLGRSSSPIGSPANAWLTNGSTRSSPSLALPLTTPGSVSAQCPSPLLSSSMAVNSFYSRCSPTSTSSPPSRYPPSRKAHLYAQAPT